MKKSKNSLFKYKFCQTNGVIFRVASLLFFSLAFFSCANTTASNTEAGGSGDPMSPRPACPDYSSYAVSLSSSEADDGFNPGEAIPAEFGTFVSSRNQSFPKLTFSTTLSGSPVNPTNYLLVLQDNDTSNFGHGIWIVDGSANFIEKTQYNFLGTTIDDKSDISSLEEYFPLARVIGRTNTFEFKLYALNIDGAAISNAVTNFVSPPDSNSSSVPNRIEAIDNALANTGPNPNNVAGGCTAILSSNEIRGTYPYP